MIDPDDIKYGFAVVDKQRTMLYHFCGYESEPSEQDYESFKLELENDPEFQLRGLAYDVIRIDETDEELLDYVRTLLRENIDRIKRVRAN